MIRRKGVKICRRLTVEHQINDFPHQCESQDPRPFVRGAGIPIILIERVDSITSGACADAGWGRAISSNSSVTIDGVTLTANPSAGFPGDPKVSHSKGTGRVTLGQFTNWEMLFAKK